jgi:tetratricopeptide (TPR) repeat protein
MKRCLALLVFGGLAVAATGPEELSDAAQKLAIEKRYAEAEKLWLEALQLSPKFFPALFNLGYMYFSQGQAERAEPVLRREKYM